MNYNEAETIIYNLWEETADSTASDALMVAKNAINKQIPMPMKKVMWYRYCPCCDKNLTPFAVENYCTFCGQKLSR